MMPEESQEEIESAEFLESAEEYTLDLLYRRSKSLLTAKTAKMSNDQRQRLKSILDKIGRKEVLTGEEYALFADYISPLADLLKSLIPTAVLMSRRRSMLERQIERLTKRLQLLNEEYKKIK